MNFLKKIIKTKQAKVILAVIGVVSMLMWAYFLAPGTEKKYIPQDGIKSSEEQSKNSPAPKNNDKTFTCTISIRCDTILNNMNLLKPEKAAVLPADGTILQTTTVTVNENESVFDLLQRVTREKQIPMEAEFTPMYNSAYIEGIHNIYEFDCGPLSGWMYNVNGVFAKYGASQRKLKNGDVIEWVYTCDLGKDIAGGYVTGGG